MVRLFYDPAWTPVAVRSVLEALPWLVTRDQPLRVWVLQDLVKERVGQLAWLRWLAEQDLRYEVAPAPSGMVGREVVWCHGQRLLLATGWLREREAVRLARRAPQRWLQEACAVLPEPQWDAPNGQPEDILVFAWVLALVTRSEEEMARALARGFPAVPAVALPPRWYHLPRPMQVALKYEGPGGVRVRLYGQAEADGPGVLTLRLPARKRVAVPGQWHGVYLLVAATPPRGRLGVALQPAGWRCVFVPWSWQNLWLYGLEVHLVGYLTRRAFRQQARRIAGSALQRMGWQAAYPGYAVPATALRSLSDLAARLYR